MTRLARPAIRVAAVIVLVVAAAGTERLTQRAFDRLRPALGLVQTVYATPDFASPMVFARHDTALDLALLDDRSDLPRRGMSIRWEGWWHLPDAGSIRFYAGADDHVWVWIDDRLVVERDVTGGFLTRLDSVGITAGVHRIRIDYVQYGGGWDLNLQWAPLDGAFRRFAPESLFPREPDAALLARVWGAVVARRAARILRVLAAVAGLVLLVIPGVIGLGRTARHRGWLGQVWGRMGRGVGNRRVQGGVATGLALLVVGWALVHRLDALNPITFWADDIWVVALASRPSLVEALTTPAPVPPGFLLLQWIARRLSSDPGVSLQVLPLAFGLAAPLVLGLVIRRVTGSLALGLVGVTFGVLDPFVAQQSVLSKQYTLDALAAVCFIAMAVRAAEGPPVPLAGVGLAGVLAALFSFPSVFVSVPVFHVLAWQALRTPGAARWRGMTVAAAFNLTMAAIYGIVMRPRASPAMLDAWRRGFAPTDDFDAAFTFVSMRWSWFLEQVLPAPFYGIAPLVAVGVAWLLVRRRWRSVGVSLLLAAAALLAANRLGWYPLGSSYYGRVLLFLHLPILLLIVVGLHGVTGWLGRWRVVVHVAAAVGVLAYAWRAPVDVTYFDHNHSRLVAELERRAQEDDVVVVNAMGSHLLSVYSGWPSDIVRDATPTQFHLNFHRPLTLTLPGIGRRAEFEESELDGLAALLAGERAPRVLFFSTRRGILEVEDAIEEAGYERLETLSSTTATHLVVYERVSPTDGGAAFAAR